MSVSIASAGDGSLAYQNERWLGDEMQDWLVIVREKQADRVSVPKDSQGCSAQKCMCKLSPATGWRWEDLRQVWGRR